MKGQIIVLARHGQTDFNVKRKIQDPFAPHLTKVGYQQAQILGKEIEKLGINFDIIISSDMSRNVETLAEIYPNYKQRQNIKIDKRLRERAHRDLTGKTKENIERELGEKFSDRLSWELYFEGTEKSKLTNKYPNDESLDSVRKRLASLISELKDKNRTLLIGSSIINQYILEYLQTGAIGSSKIEFPKGNVLDFQENNELRIVTLDKNIRMNNYSSIEY
jgi:broad specificity phosphatase PhoE